MFSVLALLPFVLAGGASSAVDPFALATLDGPSVEVRRTVQFTNRSFGADFVEWDFDYNGVVPLVDSTELNPAWTYELPGVYAVWMQACNTHGCTEVVKLIEVLPPPSDIFADGFESGDLGAWSLVQP